MIYYYIGFVARISSEILGCGIRGTDFKWKCRHLETHVRLGLDQISSEIIIIDIVIIIIIIIIIINFMIMMFLSISIHKIIIRIIMIYNDNINNISNTYYYYYYYYLGFVSRISSEFLGFGIRGTDFKCNSSHLETHVKLGLDDISSDIIIIIYIIIILIIIIILLLIIIQ